MKVLILSAIFATLLVAGEYDRQYTCIQVGEKGFTDKYKEVFNGKKMSLTYDGQVLHVSRKNTYSLNNHPLVKTKNDKFHTKDNNVVYLNNVTDGSDYLVNIEMNIIKSGIVYDTKEYFNCTATDKQGNFYDKYYIPWSK